MNNESVKIKKKRGRQTGVWTAWPPHRIEKAISLLKQGYTYSEAAKEVGASKTFHLISILQKKGLYVKKRNLIPRWLPIETAPKDGERILVDWLGIVEIAIWNIDQKNWQEWPDGDFVCDTDEITRWMPLPEPLQN